MLFSTISQFTWSLIPVVALLAFWQGKRELRKERALAKSVFIKDRDEFLSIWDLAHQWAGLQPVSKDAHAIPEEVRRLIDKLSLAFIRKEIGLRTRDGYRVTGHTWAERILGGDDDFEKVWKSLTLDTDPEFVDGLYVMRSEVLQWCSRTYTEPPEFWAPKPDKAIETSAGEEETGREWYDSISEQRKRKVACLEVTKRIWKQNNMLLYEDVRMHPIMQQAGLHTAFTPGAFKEWARPFAPEAVKLGGKRPESMTSGNANS